MRIVQFIPVKLVNYLLFLHVKCKMIKICIVFIPI